MDQKFFFRMHRIFVDLVQSEIFANILGRLHCKQGKRGKIHLPVVCGESRKSWKSVTSRADSTKSIRGEFGRLRVYTADHHVLGERYFAQEAMPIAQRQKRERLRCRILKWRWSVRVVGERMIGCIESASRGKNFATASLSAPCTAKWGGDTFSVSAIKTRILWDVNRIDRPQQKSVQTYIEDCRIEGITSPDRNVDIPICSEKGGISAIGGEADPCGEMYFPLKKKSYKLSVKVRHQCPNP